MNVKILNGVSMPNIPWQEKPADCRDVVWRYSANPIIKRDQIMVKKANGYREPSNSIFNSSVVPFKNGDYNFAGVFRVDDRERNMELHVGFSKDGINWDINEERIHFECDIPEVAEWQYGYDPRVCKLEGEDRYIVTWCNAYGWKPTIGIATTTDFKTFKQGENAYLPFNRNGVMFPRKINGKYMMMSRPSDSGHTPFGDMFISQSPDLVYWGEHRHVMGPSKGWESTKMGAGPIPIETDRGWLIFYHGVLTSCNGYVYSFSAALLDKDEPWKVLKRGASYLISPQTSYELIGDTDAVTFPCANLVDADTGRICIYYGCADTCTALAFTTVDDVMDFLDHNSQV
ncbi:MAG: glycoside hydrolase family 130 protein [Oscillospiraceae bacterium]